MSNIAYIFPGQGAQYIGMGNSLYDNSDKAREVFDMAKSVLGFDIAKLCFEGPQELLSTTSNSQPAILTVSVATLRALQAAHNSAPVYVAGLSLGEYSALVAADAMDFKDAVRLIRLRGQFMEEASKQNPGKMITILGLNDQSVEDLCKQTDCEVANLNCPGQIVVSCKIEKVNDLMELAQTKGAKKCILLDVSGPFHSKFMSQAARKLKAELEKVPISPPKVPIISNVDAFAQTDPQKIRENLIMQVDHKTLWEASVRYMASQGVNNFFEIGPGKVLKGLIRRIDAALDVVNIETPEDIKALTEISQ